MEVPQNYRDNGIKNKKDKSIAQRTEMDALKFLVAFPK